MYMGTRSVQFLHRQRNYPARLVEREAVGRKQPTLVERLDVVNAVFLGLTTAATTNRGRLGFPISALLHSILTAVREPSPHPRLKVDHGDVDDSGRLAIVAQLLEHKLVAREALQQE